MNSSTRSTGDRLIDAMRAAVPDSREEWDDLVRKMPALGLTDEEYDYFCDAIKSTEDNAYLVDIYSSGIWDNDRAMMHVLTRSYPSVIQIIRNDARTERRSPTKNVRNIIEREVYQEWTTASKANTLTSEQYDEMSVYVNALYLSSALYLNQSVSTSLQMHTQVIATLMELNSTIVPATSVILQVWEALRNSRISRTILDNRHRFLNIDSVISMATSLERSPELGEAFIRFAGERGYFEFGAALEYATTASQALNTGVL